MSTTGEPDSRSVLRDQLVAAVIEELAPEEVSLVRMLSGLEDEAALELLTRRRRRRERLGFGLESVSILLTPVVWIAVDEAVRRVIDTSVDHARTARVFRRGVFSRRRKAVPVNSPELTREQLRRIEQCVLDAARQAKVPEDKCERIADATVRRVATMSPGSEAPQLPSASRQLGQKPGEAS